MFANYDFSLFPKVIINFSENIENNEDFDAFLNQWLQLYDQKKDFSFIFNTTQVGFPPIKYCYKMSRFIRKLHQRDYHYLKKSVIMVKNKNVMRLLNIIFFIQPPVAPVYLTDSSFEDILNDKINILKYIEPKKPFLPFF